MKDSAYKISLDIHEHASQAALKAKKADTGRKLHISLRAGGTPYTIEDNCYAVFKATKPDNTILFNACSIENNEIIYEFTEQTCTSVGRCKCEIALYGPDDKIITSPRFSLLVDGTIYPNEIVESTDEFSALTKLITDTLEATNDATQAAQKADQASNDANEVINKFGDHPIKFIDNTNAEVKTVLHELPEGAYMLTGFFPYNREYDEEGIFFSNDLVSVEKYEAEDSVVVQFLVGRYLHSANITSNYVDYEKIPLRNLENKENRVATIDENSDDEHYPTAKAVYDYVGQNGGSVSNPDHSMYFDIDVDGLVSLKPEYRGLGESTTVKDENDNTIYDDYGNPVYRYPYSHSDNGLGIVGSKYVELPENLVIPDVINDIAVATFVNGMFSENHRIKSLTIPAGVTSLSEKFASKTINLAELYGTENIEVIYGAAFQYSAIKKAIFPKLKELNATGYQFNQCANLSVVDIGNTVTKIARNCFAYCDRLSLVRGGASVTGIEAKAFFGTRSLKNLPLIEKVKTIQTEAFVLSRVSNIGSGYSDWWAFYDAKVCSFNTNATPAIFNKSKWWEIEGYTPTACKNSLGSTFDQINPKWAELQLPTDSGVCKDKWGDACLEISAIHIYSALTGRKFNTPMEFMELLRGKTDNQGSLLTPVKTAEGNPDYSWGDMTRWFAALSDDEVSFETERLVHNAESFQKICVALAEGALVLTHINPRHAAVIYGVAENGEMLLLDSNGRNGYLGDHTARTYQQPIWSFALKNDDVIIVKKKEE